MAWKRRGEKKPDLITDDEIEAGRLDLESDWADYLATSDDDNVAIPRADVDWGLSDSERAQIRDVLEELYRRENEALKLYEPMEGQDEFHASMAPERLLLGGNRGGKAQPVDEPVLTPSGWRSIGSLRPGDAIIGGDGKPCRVTGVFPQGEKEVFRVTFDDGAWTRCCEEHLWKVKVGKRARFVTGKWSVVSLAEIRRRFGDRPAAPMRPTVPSCRVDFGHAPVTLPVDPYLLGLMLGDGSMRHDSALLSTADREIAESAGALASGCRLVKCSGKNYDYRFSKAGGQRNPLREAIAGLDLWGLYSHEKFVPPAYLMGSAETRLAVLRGLMDTDGSIAREMPRSGQAVEFSTTSPRLASDVEFLVRSLGGKTRTSSRVTRYEHKGEKRLGRTSYRVRISMRDDNPFRLARKASRWKPRACTTRDRIMQSIDPDGRAECVCIAVDSPDHTYVTRGFVVTHNTLGSCVEIARALTGQDPYEKYDREDGVFILVGKDERHNGRVLYKKLFMPGAFRVIYDPIMCRVRALRPWLEWDRENEGDSKPSPPLIPPRFYAPNDVAWENKRDLIPRSVAIRATNWRLLFYSGLASPPNGIDAHAAAFDEEILHPAWYTEVAARLLDHRRNVRDKRRFVNGRFWWSATPQAGTQHLYDLYERAEQCAGDEEPSITKHEATLLTNTHVSQGAKDDLIEKLKNNEDEYQVRVEGRFAILGSRIYPEFMPRGVHGCPVFPIPADWTRYVAVDPGRQVAAALFVAIPPTTTDHVKVGDELIYVRGKKIIYDELYVKRCSAAIFAERLAAKVGEQVIQQWWIDLHAGRITEMGSGLTVEQQYAEECKKNKVGCVSTGHRFTWARDDVKAGIEAVKRGLHVREDGRAEWLVFAENVPNMIDESKKYVYKKLGNTQVVTDEPMKKYDHLMDCWRYLAMASLKYVAPAARRARKNSAAYDAMQAKKKAERARRGPPAVKVW